MIVGWPTLTFGTSNLSSHGADQTGMIATGSWKVSFVCLSQINPHLKNWPQSPVTEEGLILLRDGSEWSGKWSKEKLHGLQLTQQINSPCRRAKSFRSLSRLSRSPVETDLDRDQKVYQGEKAPGDADGHSWMPGRPFKSSPNPPGPE